MARTVDPEAHARRRETILSAAAVEFAAHGVRGTTTAAICRRAGIGSGTLFHYFPTKDAVFRSLFSDDVDRISALGSHAADASDPAVGLRLVTDHLLSEVGDPLAPGLAQAAQLYANEHPDFADLLAANDEAVFGILHSCLSRLCTETDRLLPFPADAAARWIQGVVDAAHLGLGQPIDEGGLDQLRDIIGWLCGETSRDRRHQ